MPSRLPDLSYGREIAIWCATVAVVALVFLRAAVAIPRMIVSEHRYPATWTVRQIEYLKVTRRCAGIVLFAAWLMLIIVAPFLPQRYPFSQSSAVLMIALFVQTYAFLIMVSPQDWNESPIAKVNFIYVLAAVAIWWIAFLGTTTYAMVSMTLPRVLKLAPAIPINLA